MVPLWLNLWLSIQLENMIHQEFPVVSLSKYERTSDSFPIIRARLPYVIILLQYYEDPA